MTALPTPANEHAVRAAVERLSRIQPGAYQVVSCYLKLEPRDRSRGKYLIKMKNRVRETESALSRQPLSHQEREIIAADLHRVLTYLEEPNHLPRARAIALFASRDLGLFEV